MMSRLTFLSTSFGLLMMTVAVAACGPANGSGNGDIDAKIGPGTPDSSVPQPDSRPFADGGMLGCNDVSGCFTVWAHGDHELYLLDLKLQKIQRVGPFNAPKVMVGTMMLEDVITDLAVAPDNTIYCLSATNLYTASPTDGHVTLVEPLASCGTKTVAMTFTNDGKLLAGDFNGAFCSIDITKNPPVVTQIASSLGMGMALSGDMVAVSDGTIFGTAYLTTDASGKGTQANNKLVKLDPTTGQITQVIGSTGFPNLFGVAFDQGKVFGFTHDKTGRVVTIDPMTGVGTLYGTFNDPVTNMPISFAGAGVSPMVPIVGKPTN